LAALRGTWVHKELCRRLPLDHADIVEILGNVRRHNPTCICSRNQKLAMKVIGFGRLPEGMDE
jgi:hypothetical protein